MRRKTAVAVAMVLAVSAGWFAGGVSAAAAAQAGAPCLVNVPPAWGDYMGNADNYGFVFRDSEGTLRIVRNLPCGLEGPPAVSLIIRRK